MWVSECKNSIVTEINVNSKCAIDDLKIYTDRMYVSHRDVVELYNVSNDKAYSMLAEATGMYKSERIKYWLKKELEVGRTISEISNLFGISIFRARKYYKDFGLESFLIGNTRSLTEKEISDLKKCCSQKELNEISMILNGSTLREISKQFGYTREEARLRIEGYGLHTNWMDARKPGIFKIRNDKRMELIDVLRKHKMSLQIDMSYLDNKALEYAERYRDLKGTRKIIPELYAIFRAYFELSSKKDRPNFYDLERASGCNHFTCSDVLRRIGLVDAVISRKRNKV